LEIKLLDFHKIYFYFWYGKSKPALYKFRRGKDLCLHLCNHLMKNYRPEIKCQMKLLTWTELVFQYESPLQSVTNYLRVHTLQKRVHSSWTAWLWRNICYSISERKRLFKSPHGITFQTTRIYSSIIHIKKPTRCNSVSKFYFRFIWSLTCFGQHTIHHQEPKTALAASGFAYMEGCWLCSCWTLSASSNYTANNPPRMQNQRLLVQF